MFYCDFLYFILIGPLSYFEFLDAMDNSGSLCVAGGLKVVLIVVKKLLAGVFKRGVKLRKDD